MYQIHFDSSICGKVYFKHFQTSFFISCHWTPVVYNEDHANSDNILFVNLKLEHEIDRENNVPMLGTVVLPPVGDDLFNDGFIRLTPEFLHTGWEKSSTALVEYQKRPEVHAVIHQIEEYEKGILKP